MCLEALNEGKIKKTQTHRGKRLKEITSNSISYDDNVGNVYNVTMFDGFQLNNEN